ncbi:MAG: hypothetical protein LUE98_21205 [Tannerellaceae bacterium]|nr:hypothetical protein [Tannerellaceae bacterium]
MKSTDIIQPTAISQPIANTGTRNTISQTATGSGYASVAEGFPDITMIAPADGGLPPRGEDCNGLFYLSTDQKVYLQNGGYITFNEEVSELIGGYPQGAILDYYNSDTNVWAKVISLVDDNTNNFVDDPSLIDGTNWKYANIATTSWGAITGNIENQTDLQEALTDIKDNYLPLSGGTLTGAVVSDMPLDDAVSAYNANFVIVNPNYTVTSTVDGTEHQGGALSIVDTDGERLVQFRAYQSASAGHCASIENWATIDGTSYASFLRTYINDDGTSYVCCPTYTTYTDSSTKICTTAFLKNVLKGSGYGLMTYSKANNLGYMKFANGLILQWGTSSGTITFATAMSNSSYCFLDGIKSTSSGNQSGGWTSKSTTGCVTTYGSAGGLNWMVIGY